MKAYPLVQSMAIPRQMLAGRWCLAGGDPEGTLRHLAKMCSMDIPRAELERALVTAAHALELAQNGDVAGGRALLDEGLRQAEHARDSGEPSGEALVTFAAASLLCYRREVLEMDLPWLGQPYWSIGAELWTTHAFNAVGRCFCVRDGLPLDGSVHLSDHSATKTVLDLLTLTENDLLSVRGVGPGVVRVVQRVVATRGLTLAPNAGPQDLSSVACGVDPSS